MTFLPIVERELRVAARRRETYRSRMLNAGAATLAFLFCFVASLVDPSVSFVKSLFWGLSGLCMVYCLAAGRLMTADCLSREKREGTLGLLFLTDLKGYDVVLGKLAATSMNGFYGLLAMLPLLALPLLAGGMTNGEFWRMALVLVNTFFFTAAIGLFVSSVSRDERKAMGANLALLLLLAALPPAVFGMMELPKPRPAIVPGWFFSCPVYSFYQCADARYKILPEDFWYSIGVTFCLTLFLLLLACRTAPRSWQDKPVSARSLRRKGARPRRWWLAGSAGKAAAFRKRALDRNAYFWLAARAHVKVFHVWAAVGMVVCFWAFTGLAIKNPFDDSASTVFSFLLNFTLKMWIASEAGRQLAEDKKSGAFELLLSTPLTVGDIVRGQWLALRRQFLKPVAVAAGLELVLTVVICKHQKEDQADLLCSWLALILMLGADAFTLGWVAMSASLTAKNHGRAIVKTTFCVLALPWLLFGGLEMVFRLFMFLFVRQSWDPDWPFDLGCWFGAGIFVDILFAFRARRQLQTKFHQLAVEASGPKRRFAWLLDWRSGSPERRAELHVKFRRVAIPFAILLATGAATIAYDLDASRSALPKPVVALLGRSNDVAQVFNVQDASQEGLLFILPDGSLWTWGRQGKVSPPRQIGTNQDWLQVSVQKNALGLRANGTLWNWSAETETPQQFGSDHNWSGAWHGNDFCVARKRDGTLWAWGDNRQFQLGNGRGPNRPNPVQVGTNRDWRDVSIAAGGVVAIRSNGTLWMWGSFGYFKKRVLNYTNYQVPVPFCREGNWVDFNSKIENGARNQTGETWSFNNPTGLPGASVPIAAIGHLLSSNSDVALVASGPVFISNWQYGKYELKTNGTLWTEHNGLDRRFGARSDWVAVWGSYQTMIGMTSDGILWTWGVDYGQESHWVSVFPERIAQIRSTLGEIFGNASGSDYGYISDQYPAQKEPRPLLKLVFTNSILGRLPAR